AYDIQHLGLVDWNQGRPEQARTRYLEALVLFAGCRERRGAAACLELLAMLAAESREPSRAARLFAAAEAMRESIGTPLALLDPTKHEASIAPLRSALGEA